jgi:hypothetical protein
MELREITVTPHIAGNTTRRSAIDGPVHSASRLRNEPAHPEAHRLDQDRRWLTKNKISRARKSLMGFHPPRRSVQLDQIVKVDVRRMSGTGRAPPRCAEDDCFFNSLL